MLFFLHGREKGYKVNGNGPQESFYGQSGAGERAGGVGVSLLALRVEGVTST